MVLGKRAATAEFTYLGAANIGVVPVSSLMAVLIFVGAGLFFRYHRTGRSCSPGS
jgi:ribose/xylose/arabinose/galactoside ABC-type transport system permease subunit